MAFPFTKEAERAINLYLENLNKKINHLGFEVSDERRKDFLLAIYHSLKLSSIRHAKKRGSIVAEEKDARASFKFLSPKMLIKHGLQTPKILPHVEELKIKHFQIMKEKAASSGKFRVLDAGCGWGRQLMEFFRYGLKSEFFGVDIDIEAIKYGKSVEPSIIFIGADLQGNLPFKDNVFDAIVCIGVLHLTDVNKTIQEFARILKPKGLLFVTQTFTRNKLIASLAYLIWRLVPKIGRLYYIIDIEKILGQNRFTRIIMDKAFSTALMIGDIYFCTAFIEKHGLETPPPLR